MGGFPQGIRLTPDVARGAMRDSRAMKKTSHLASAILGPDVEAAIAISDPLAVVSLTLDTKDAVAPGRAAVHAVEVELDRIGARPEVDTATGRRALGALRALLDSARSREGVHGVAAFAGLATGESADIELEAPLPTGLTVGRRAAVRPLVAALGAGRPAGVALISHEGVVLLEWRVGVVNEIWREVLPELESRSLAGPARAHPRDVPGAAPGYLVGQQRDLYERRHLTEEQRLITAAAARVITEAGSRGWRELVAGGDPRLTTAFAGAVTRSSEIELVTGRRIPQQAPHARLEPTIAQIVAEARDRQTRRLIDAILDHPAPGGRGALSVDDVAAALMEGRVDTLLLHPSATIVGRSNAAGELAGPTYAAPGIEVGTLAEDTMLADALIGQALATRAGVVVASHSLADEIAAQPVTALLRWP